MTAVGQSLRRIAASASSSTLQLRPQPAATTSPVCWCSLSKRRRALHTSPRRSAAFLTTDTLDKRDDPLDMMNLEQFQWDDVPWVAHQALDDDRDRINLMRLIAFQMPEIRKAFPVANYPIDPSTPIVIRTQHYLGQPEHPASRKAVLSVKVEDLERLKKLTSAQSVHKFKLLAGPRYDPDRGSIKISSDSFPDPSMNAKWCSDALDRLIAEAQDLTDSMQDIPLDLRHAEVRKLKKGKRRATIKDFPVDWLPPKATE